MSRPRYISAVLTLKPERRRRTDRGKGGAGRSVVGRLGGADEGAGRVGRKKEGRERGTSPQIHENSAAH